MAKLSTIELDGFTRNQVATSSAITTAKTRMTATELKAFYQVATLINKDDTDFQEYSIGVKEFCNELELNSSNRDFIIKTLKNLLRQVFEIDEKDGDYIGYTIFSKLHYKKKEQKIHIKFSDEIKPFLLQLKNNFTHIKQVKYLKKLESKYAIRIYVLLKDYRLMSQRDIEIKELKEMFQLPKSYTTFKDIRVKVLEPAFDEINKKTDLEIYSIEPLEKQGKKIVSIRIKFGNKGDKIASDIIKYLDDMLKKTKDYNIFIGFPYSPIKPKNRKECLQITKIEVEKIKDGLYYTLKSGQSTIFATGNKGEFDTNLLRGIFNATEFIADSEKALYLDMTEWQEQQDKINRIKSMLNKWKDRAEKLKF